LKSGDYEVGHGKRAAGAKCENVIVIIKILL